MKTLFQKEIRENVLLAALGLVVVAVLLFAMSRVYGMTLRALPLAGGGMENSDLLQPLISELFLVGANWFCAVFAGILGWVQIQNERPRDLWSFLVHRPLSRTQIFVAKAAAGLGIYFAVAIVPLLLFVLWLRFVAGLVAPFEWAMLLPVTATILSGVVYYFAGMLVALRQARWYASRLLPVLVALVMSAFVIHVPTFLPAVGALLVVAGLLAIATWGGFFERGADCGQPALGKAGLTVSLTIAATTIGTVVAAGLVMLVLQSGRYQADSSYVVRKDGEIYKMIRERGRPMYLEDLQGRPLTDSSGKPVGVGEFHRRTARHLTLFPEFGGSQVYRTRLQQSSRFFIPWRITSDTAWYFWRQYGRLVAFDLATHQLIGSLGPEGFASGTPAGRARFLVPSGYNPTAKIRTLRTANAVYQVDLDQRTSRPFFSSTEAEPIGAAEDYLQETYEWDYTVVVTRHFVHLLTPDGKLVWKANYQATDPDPSLVQVYFLEPSGTFVLWEFPPDRLRSSQPSEVTWLDREKGATKNLQLPPLGNQTRPGWDMKLANVLQPAVYPLSLGREPDPDWEAITVCLLAAVLVYVPLTWWLATRFAYSARSRAAWSVYVLLTGFPGFLAFLSVAEWPARERCPNCGRLRVVNRASCEHCGSAFSVPPRRGTEIFATVSEAHMQTGS